jgi:hypothetical protein
MQETCDEMPFMVDEPIIHIPVSVDPQRFQHKITALEIFGATFSQSVRPIR